MAHRDHFLYYMALGDSFGMKYEFVPHAQGKTAADLVHGPHPKFQEYETGKYTDDTQMSLANLMVLLDKSPAADPGIYREGNFLCEADFIEAWLAAFKQDPRRGYSKFMYQVLSECDTVADFKKTLGPAAGKTSGGAMRAGPFGLLADAEKVKELTEMQARATHNSVTGVTAALAVALAVHYLHHGGARQDLDSFLEKHLGSNWNGPQNGYVDTDLNNGLKIVTQALNAFKGAKTLSEVLLNAVNNDPASDTDTVCAIAMIVASRCTDIADDLPETLTRGLENGYMGAAQLQSWDTEAMRAFPPSNMYGKKPPGPKPKPKLNLW